MKLFRKKFFKLSLSIFFLMLYSGVYLSSGYWHSHHQSSAKKSISFSKAENCDYCKLVSNNIFDLTSNGLSFQKNAVIHFCPFLPENIFSAAVLNQHNKAPPVKA